MEILNHGLQLGSRFANMGLPLPRRQKLDVYLLAGSLLSQGKITTVIGLAGTSETTALLLCKALCF